MPGEFHGSHLGNEEQRSMKVSTRTTVYEGFGWHLYRDAEDEDSLWLEVRSQGNAAVDFRLETRVPDAIARIIEEEEFTLR